MSATSLPSVSAPPSANRSARARMIAAAWPLAVMELAFFLFFAAGAHGWIVPLDKPNSTDFVSFHAAGALANAGTPWLAYDRAAHHAAEQAAAAVGVPYNYFFYPPPFLLLCAPLARLPYLLSFCLFQGATAALCFRAARMIRAELPLIVFAAFPLLWWTIGTGQNALLTAALFAAGTALIDRRPWLAGVCLGALCYKPHVGILIPVALVAGLHWRALLSALVTVLALIGLSALWFGIETWTGFVTAMLHSADVYAAHAIFMDGMTSPYGAAMALGAERPIAVAIQAVAIAAAGTAVAVTWSHRTAPLPVRAAVLLAATPVASPVMMFYDLMLLLPALLWLSRVPPERQAGSGWRAAGMAVVFAAPLASGNLSMGPHLLFAAGTAMTAFLFTLAVAWRARPWFASPGFESRGSGSPGSGTPGSGALAAEAPRALV